MRVPDTTDIMWSNFQDYYNEIVSDTDLDDKLREYLDDEDMNILYDFADKLKTYVRGVSVYHNRLTIVFANRVEISLPRKKF